jgi:RNA polymerase sigma factor (sigma-70 family)
MPDKASSANEPDDTFETLFRREFGPISRVSYLIVGDWEVAREVTQDAFVQVLRHWEKVRQMESPGGWARRVAIRKAVRTRHRDAHGRLLLRSRPQPLVEASEVADEDVHRALLTLPRRQRAAIALYYLEDRPIPEIATLLGCGETTVRTHLARGRRALADRLGEEFTDECG